MNGRLIRSEPLVKEVPAVGGYKQFKATGWLRLTLVLDDGSVVIADCQKKHLTRIKQTA